MSPIDLSGKIFCSNCGMTIGNNSKPVSVPTISHIQTDDDDRMPTDKLTSPSSQPTKTEVVTQDESQKVRDELMKMMAPTVEPAQPPSQIPEPAQQTEIIEAEKQQNSSSPDQPEEPKIADMASTDNQVPTEPMIKTLDISTPITEMQPKDESPAPEVPEPVSGVSEPAPSLPDEPVSIPVTNLDGNAPTAAPVVDTEATPTETPVAPELVSDTEKYSNVGLQDNKQSEKFSEKVKEIDTLGASGVLLDILDDAAIAKEREQKTETLKAAEDLIDDLNFEAENKPAKKAAASSNKKTETIKPKEAGKHASLEKKATRPIVPVFTPEEIEAALTGKELPKKAEGEPIDKNDFKPSENDIIDALVQTTAEDLHKEQTYNQDMDNPRGVEVKSAAVKNYFNNIFKKA
jgi:hypothetical protein